MSIRFALLFLLSQVLLSFVDAQNSTQLRADLEAAEINAVFPGDPGYSEAITPHNLRFSDIRPFAVSYPIGASQVSIALNAATKQGLKVTTRSGGHSYIAGGLGTSDGHFVIDLSQNTHFSYDNSAEVATIDTGLTLGLVALHLNEFGRAIPHGRCSYVGVGGHAGHGGFGHHSRMWGLFLDIIEEATVVTSDGVVRKASSSENPDLFWAIRGAGSSFGVITQLRIKTFPQPPEASIFRYSWRTLSVSEASQCLSAFQQYALHSVDSRFGGELILRPSWRQEGVSVEFFGGYWGPHDELHSTLEPFLEQLPEADTTSVTQGTYFEALESWVHLPLNTTIGISRPETFYAKSVVTHETSLISDTAIESFLSYLADSSFSSPIWWVEIPLYGGRGSAIASVPANSTAWAHRSALFTFQLYSPGTRGNPGFQYMDAMVDSLTLTGPQGSSWPWNAYIGYPDERQDNWQSRYYGVNYPRLQDLKSLYDPANTFSFPMSIEPR